MSTPVTCQRCGKEQLVPEVPVGFSAECFQCSGSLGRNIKNGAAQTFAFSLAALFLYIPANIFPILHFDLYGATTDNTVWQGVVRLSADGDTIVAVIVFLASIAIPLIKLIALFYLSISTAVQSDRFQKGRTRIHQSLEFVGRWAMLDVFLVAILVAFVKLQKLATVLPGPGVLTFTAVVILTLLASASYDPRLIWKKP